MFKTITKKWNIIRPVLLFGLNFLLMFISWEFSKTPKGDEYLILFMIPLVFIVAPFVMRDYAVGSLFLANSIFFVLYKFTGILNPIDVTVFMILLACAGGGGYLLRYLYLSFSVYQENDISNKRNMLHKYNMLDRI